MVVRRTNVVYVALVIVFEGSHVIFGSAGHVILDRPIPADAWTGWRGKRATSHFCVALGAVNAGESIFESAAFATGSAEDGMGHTGS